MSESAGPVRHAAVTVAIAAAGVGIIANLAVSGLTVDVINDAVRSVVSLDPKDPENFFTVGKVFAASAPLVLGTIVTVVLLVEWNRAGEILGYPHLFGMILLWAVVGQSSASAVGTELLSQTLQVSGGGHPAALLLRTVVWAVTPYGFPLALQGLFLGGVAAASYYLYQEKHAATP